MKNLIFRKSILKVTFVLFLVVTLILTSIFIFPVTAVQKQYQDIVAAGIKSENKESLQTSRMEKIDPSMKRGDWVIFSQRPYTPDESWNFYTSDSNSGYFCQEDFWGLDDSTILDVHWYGLTLIYGGGWMQGDPTGMKFEIKFYENNNGTPGAVIGTYSDIDITPVNTGQLFYGFPMYYWEAYSIDQHFMSDGWISIQSTYSPDGSWFLWASSPEGNFNAIQNGENLGVNLAFNLTGWPSLYHDVRIDSIIQPVSGPAGVIAPIINVSNIGNYFPEDIPVNVQITSKELEYNQTQIIRIDPGRSAQVVFPNWTPDAWDTIKNETVNYTIVVNAYLPLDHDQSDNTLTQSFTLTYPNRLFMLGFISNRTEDNTSISFDAKHLFYYNFNTSNFGRLFSNEKIIISKEHIVGYIGRRVIIGIFDAMVFSS